MNTPNTTLQDANVTLANEQHRDYAKRTPRELAYRAIDSEREHQIKLHGDDTRHSGVDLEMIIQRAKMLDEAHGTDKQPEIVREIAAIAVRYMEQHGAPLRT